MLFLLSKFNHWSCLFIHSFVICKVNAVTGTIELSWDCIEYNWNVCPLLFWNSASFLWRHICPKCITDKAEVCCKIMRSKAKTSKLCYRRVDWSIFWFCSPTLTNFHLSGWLPAKCDMIWPRGWNLGSGFLWRDQISWNEGWSKN